MVESQQNRSGIGLIIERVGPLGISAASIVLIVCYADEIVAQFQASDGWQVASLYDAVFNWSAIQTGFAFGVFGFVVGKNDGFIQEIRDMLAMKRFLGYVRRANIGGFTLTIFSLPLTIANPNISATDSVMFFFVVAWFGLFVWTFFAFLRVAYGFGHLSSVRDQPEFYGAGT